ncbi:MAG: DNA repair protein RecN [Candidatus Kapaibacterium sp.]|jgi:DNA repair protein RecN (Recombination protein N)
MLRSLYIKNYALIEEFTVAFDRGLNIITGETGAGKSIILGAFSLLIGERSSGDLVRSGADKAIVEAEFELKGNPRLKKFLAEHEVECEDGGLIIRREVLARGTGRGYINDAPATAQLLKELGGYLVDLHGQHEHQSLLRTEGHIVLLDEFGELTESVDAYQDTRGNHTALLKELDALKAKHNKLKEERELFEFQLQEISAVDPKPEEDREIDEELRVLEHSEELRDSAIELHKSLYSDEGSAYERLSVAKIELDRLGKIDGALAEQLADLQSALTITDELAKFLSHYSDTIEFSPERLRSLRERGQVIARLKKKYGGSLAAALQKKQELESKLTSDEELDALIESKNAELLVVHSELTKRALALTKARKKVAKSLEPEVVTALKELGIEHGQFVVQFTEREFGARGMDQVEFFLSTNAGESAKPLTKVASGGEVSRIMLSLKSILAKNDKLPLMVFDEIDVGVSGRVAQRVGRAMQRLAKDHQLIAITHLAQIAAFAGTHFLVEKKSTDTTTSSALRKLSKKEHVSEVARLISGADVTTSSIRAAEKLIEEAKAD